MNISAVGFISLGEIVLVLFMLLLYVVIPIGIIFFVVRYFFMRRSKWFSKELNKQFNSYQDSPLTQKNIKDYYPVKEGNKITLIRFDEIVDFSASNNYIFLTDITGKDYLVDASLMNLEAKLPKEFIRVHKSTIINRKLIQKVKKLGNGKFDLVMKCEKERIINCSKNYNDKIKSIIDF